MARHKGLHNLGFHSFHQPYRLSHCSWLLSLGLLCVALGPSLCAGDIVERWLVVGNMTLNPTCISPRVSVVFNNSWPGPTITASDGDTLVIHVYNNQTYPITIHWHGITQDGSQWYDGVPGVTQCTIAYKKSFTYIFQIKNQWGTFWYHAHVAQLRNTMHGALIIRPPVNNAEPLNVDIEGELLLMGGDWFKESPQQLMNSITAPPYPGYPLPKALHINGKSLCSGLQYFTVKPGCWYRMRIINTAMWASFNLKIEGHAMVLHEVEGGYLQHQTVSMLDVYPGQSYSVLIQTNKKPGNYWVVLNPRYDVEKGVATRGLAVLSYMAKTVTPSPPNSPIPPGPQGADKNKAGPIFQSNLRSPYVNQQLRTAFVRKLIVLELNQNTFKSGQQVYSMNNVSLTGGSMPFLLADYHGVGKKVYSTTLTPDLPPKGLATQKDGPTKVAASVIQIPYGWWVQVVFQNHVPPGGLHPWHLHGYDFYVVGQGTGRFDPKKWLQYKYNLRNPPYRNTVAMFENTWVAIRFRATNPGQWILHCHVEQHADQGLATVFKVLWPTTPVTSRPPPLSPPPRDYPACPKK